MPSTYNHIDLTKPDPATQAGTAFGNSSRDQIKVAIVALACGELEGFTYSQSGGTAQYPGIQLLTNGVYRIRRTLTWGNGTPAGTLNNITAAVLEWSDDSGGTYVTVASETRTYDTNGNLTATTAASGMMAFAEALYGRFSVLNTSFTAHAAATGTAVHGLGTMATQSAASVAVTGGAIDGAVIGGTTPAAVSATTFTGKGINLGATITASVAVDWSAGDYFYATFTGAGAALTWSNLPAADKIRGVTIEITNAGLATNPWPAGVKWPGGAAPTRTSGASAVDIYEFHCRDGSTVRGVQAEKDTK